MPRTIPCGGKNYEVFIDSEDRAGAVARVRDAGDRELMGLVEVAKEGLWISSRGEWNVVDSAVRKEIRRCGIGTALYEEAAKAALRNGARKFCSSDTLSEFSIGFWQKQVAKGRAARSGGVYCLTNWKHRSDLSGLKRRKRRSRR